MVLTKIDPNMIFVFNKTSHFDRTCFQGATAFHRSHFGSSSTCKRLPALMSLLDDVSDVEEPAQGQASNDRQFLLADVSDTDEDALCPVRPPKRASARFGGMWERRSAMASLRARKAELKAARIETEQAQEVVKLYECGAA
eukprot:14346681-Heterocapsa_arctica.AAC.1